MFFISVISSNGIADIQAEIGITASNPIRPMSAFHVRNRLLSRMGAQVMRERERELFYTWCAQSYTEICSVYSMLYIHIDLILLISRFLIMLYMLMH